jgi:hypothetical protein
MENLASLYTLGSDNDRNDCILIWNRHSDIVIIYSDIAYIVAAAYCNLISYSTT